MQLRALLLPVLLLLALWPGAQRSHPVAAGSTSSAYVLAVDAAEVPAVMQSRAATAHVAHLGVSPRTAWQSKHDRLKDNRDLHPSFARVARFTFVNESCATALRIAVTGSVSFCATSLPPPVL